LVERDLQQWISMVKAYYGPYMIYHVRHARNVFPELGIASDEKVAYALPKIEVGPEGRLAHGQDDLLGAELILADFCAFKVAPEGNMPYPRLPAFSRRWRERMERLPAVKQFRPTLPPRAPIEHAREWAVSHRPKY
jgi:glutathione S-transferase